MPTWPCRIAATGFTLMTATLITKRTFGVLEILLSLTDAGETARGPVVSIGGS